MIPPYFVLICFVLFVFICFVFIFFFSVVLFCFNLFCFNLFCFNSINLPCLSTCNVYKHTVCMNKPRLSTRRVGQVLVRFVLLRFFFFQFCLFCVRTVMDTRGHTWTRGHDVHAHTRHMFTTWRENVICVTYILDMIALPEIQFFIDGTHM